MMNKIAAIFVWLWFSNEAMYDK